MLRSIVLVANGTSLGDWGFPEFTVACTLSHPPLRSRDALNKVQAYCKRTGGEKTQAMCSLDFIVINVDPHFIEWISACLLWNHWNVFYWREYRRASLGSLAGPLLSQPVRQNWDSPTNCTQEQGSDALHASLHCTAGKRTNLKLISR